MYILYGSCVRFYSTVVEWDFLGQMKEDLIERLTSMVFSEAYLSQTVLRLCHEITTDQNTRYLKRIDELKGLKPVSVGVSPYLTLDKDSNIEQFVSLVSDMGGSDVDNDWNLIDQTLSRQSLRARLSKQPYFKSTKQFQLIAKAITPIQKLNILG